ncbi:MAG: hypothetical protein AAFY82_02190 [Pseudomonadota bacterium]
MAPSRDAQAGAHRRRMFEDEPVFASVAIVIAVAGGLFVVAGLFDDRLVLGENVWIKPTKFALALSVYLGTLAYYARWLPNGLTDNRLYRGYSMVIASAVLAELVWVAGAAAFGLQSHFNRDTQVMAVLYPIMGALAVILTSAALFFGLQIAVHKTVSLSPALKLAVSGGLILTFFSTVLVALYLASNGGHHVGVPSNRDAVLIGLGWSRDVGDLRVPHFFATHALHVVPLVGLVSHVAMPPRLAFWSTCLMLLLYTGLIAFTFVQARAGVPFL